MPKKKATSSECFNTLQINCKMYKAIIWHLYIIQRFYKFTKLKEFQTGQFWNCTIVWNGPVTFRVIILSTSNFKTPPLTYIYLCMNTASTSVWYSQLKLMVQPAARALVHSDSGFRQRVRVHWHLDTTLPLLLPLICYYPVLIWWQWLRVRQLHGTDQVFSKQLNSKPAALV